nr:acetylcholinesterase 1-like [Ciona intestinalis]|eukprot:XP_002120606.4 acetylcholinesterase 1-like [Ciona intestinalis]
MVEPFRVTIDGAEFATDPMSMFAGGVWNKDKQIIIGTNADEMSFVDAYIPEAFPMPFKVFEKFNKFVFGDELGQEVANAYKLPGVGGDYKHTLGIEIADLFFHCPVRMMARLASSTTPTYMYSFAHGMNGSTCAEAWGGEELCGTVFHGSENSFLFRTSPLIEYNATSEDNYVSDEFSFYWGNFAHSGDPTMGGVMSQTFPAWPQYTAEDILVQGAKIVSKFSAGYTNIKLDYPDPSLENEYNKEMCDFWDNTGYYSPTTFTTIVPPDVTTTPPSDVTTTLPGDVTTTSHNDITTTTVLPAQPEKTTSGGKSSFMTSQMSLMICFVTSLFIV